MIEATCAACGTLNRIPEADVPTGAKFVPCTSCKSRVPLPATAGPALPALPAVGKPTASQPPKIPSIPSIGGPKPIPGPTPATPAAAAAQTKLGPPTSGKAVLPAKPFVPDLPKATGGTNDVIDLADLPAPKRTSALGAEPSRPAPKSGLAAAADADLPAPKSPTRPPPNLPGAGSLELDDLLAPVRGNNEIVDLPAPKASPVELADLPAPKRTAGGPPVLDDLPAPKRTAGGPPVLDDLPAPKRATAGPPLLDDLPAPKRTANSGNPLFDDLPAPKQPSAGIVDLPAPKQPSAGIVDLPAPKQPAGIVDLPAPKGGLQLDDLPAPKPVAGATDLPAPKGFFDDLPSSPRAPTTQKPAPADLPAPKGFFDDLPSSPRAPTAQKPAPADLPAPKGFFDDLPSTPRAPTTQKAAPVDLPAPKGFFDDLPSSPRTTTAAPADGPSGTFALDLGPPNAAPSAPVAGGRGFFDDIPAANLRPTRDLPQDFPAAAAGPALELEPHAASTPELDLELAAPPRTPVTFEVEKIEKPAPKASEFDDLDLSKPTAPPPPKQMDQGTRDARPGITFNPSSTALPASTAAAASFGKGSAPAAELALELEGGPRQVEAPRADKRADKRADAKPEPTPAAAKRKRQLVMGGVLAVVVLGGGGAFFYKRHADATARAEELDDKLKAARAQLAATTPGHWSSAFGAANQALALDDKNPIALGIAAEASMAGALDDGTNYDGRIGNGRRFVQQALTAGLRSPELDRAIALQAITTSPAVTDRLEQMHRVAPKDLALTLYLGWGQALKGDHAAAVKTFDELVGTPLKVSALYARGRSKLALADLEGATADFAAILETQREHVGAMVGLAAALPPAKIGQQETDLDGIIHRKDFATVDPRVRILAHVLLGDDAQRSGRLDVARASYRAALEIAPNDVSATAGLAEVELRDGKIDAAKEPVDKAVRLSPNDARAQLVACWYSIKHGDFDDAQKRLAALGNRTPPLAPLEQARLFYLTGELHETQKDDLGAADAYVQGAQAAGELDLAPTMAAVRVLSRLASKEQDPKRAQELRDKADGLLATLAAKAKDDPQLALALGTAYLQSGDATKAEPLLRQVADARPKDPEPLFQLGKALAKLGRPTDAIAALERARNLDKTRPDLGFELASADELAGRDAEATVLYNELGKLPDLSIEFRGRACRFFARTKNFEQARAQGEAIAKVDASDPAGLYCRGEGLLADKKGEVARQLFAQAVQGDPENPQYLDAQGRAAELVVDQSGDTKFQDEALRVYQDAVTHDKDKKLLNPLVGQGRIYFARQQWSKIVEVLPAADALKKNDPDISYMMGVAAQNLGDKKGAIAWLQVAVATRPTADAMWRIGTMYYDLNQVPQTLTAFQRAIGLAHEEEKKTGQKLAWLNDVLYTYGDLSTDENVKREAFREFVDRHPEDSQRLRTAQRLLSTTLRTP